MEKRVINVVKQVSKQGKEYVCLSCDLGYTVKKLFVSVPDIAEILDLRVADISSLCVGQSVPFAVVCLGEK